MSLGKEINAYFVKTRSGAAENEDFENASVLLSSHVSNDAIRHIKASEGYPLIASGQLTKKDVFIFDHFEGDFFKQLQQTKSLILGPRCLLTCLTHIQPIPHGKSPIYTTAMRDLIISASGISLQEKEELSLRIQWMGGHYLQNLNRSVTHLISNTIKSSKYEHASLNGIPVMHVDWVKRVWERSLVSYVSATDQEFDKYRLPIFFDTNITSTGLETAKKDEIMRLVQENGGTYHRAFRSQLVDIVIAEKGKTDSEKYKAAQSLKKDILTTDWIFDSVKRGFALPTKDYQVKSLKVSTPTKPDQSLADFTSTDHTQLSEISRISAPKLSNDVTVNDTMCSNLNDTHQATRKSKESTFQAPAPPVPATNRASVQNLQRDVLMKNVESTGLHYRDILEDISPREAKKAGSFLDGCCIYLSGFRTAEKEKLNRILNSGGATRYDAINDEITHIIVGQTCDADFKAWKKDGLRATAHIVRLDWLLESIKLKQTANENIFRVSLPNSREPDAPSPSSKKTLISMNHSFKQPDLPTKKKLFATDNDKSLCNATSEPSGLPRACSTELPLEDDEHELLAQYSQEHMAIPVAELPPPTAATPKTSKNHKEQEKAATTVVAAGGGGGNNTEMTTCSIDYDNLDVFKNLIIYVDRENFPEELYTQMQRECDAAQANVVCENFRDPVDYAIVTFEQTFNIAKLPVEAKYIVTELYVETCMKENRLVPIEYFHKPIPHTADVQPLKGMIIVISVYADFEREYIDSLAKLLGAKVNEVYSKKEHPLLICPEAKGAKYLGALKWHFPVVTSDWLVQCADQGIKLPLRPYLVGESAAEFPSPKAARASYIEEDVEMAQRTTSGDEVTPLRNKRVTELAVTPAALSSVAKKTPPSNSNINQFDSPHTPANMYGRAAYKFEYMEKILDDIEDASDREFVRGIIEDIRKNPTPELERIKRQVCTPANRRLSNSPNAVPDFCNTPEFKRRMAEEFDKRWHLPTKKLKPSTPIEQIRKRVIRATCRDLGIAVSSDEDENAPNESNENATPVDNNIRTKKQVSIAKTTATSTHFTPVQHRGSTSSKIEPRSIFAMATPNLQPRRSMADDNSYVPNTQDAVQEAASNRNERNSNSPHTALAAAGVRPSLVGKSTIDFDKISFEETTMGASVNTLRKSVTANSSPELKHIMDFLKERENRRQSTRDSVNAADNMAIKQQQNEKQLEIAVPMETEALAVQPFETEQLCTDSEGLVGWQDPIEFNKVKLASKVRTMQYEGTPRFSISSTDDIRDSIIEKIHKLGGEVSTNLTNFDPECTHFVCERPNRGEKILGCISAGKWVLSLKYIEECYAKDNFIDEELYEWGNPKAVNMPNISPDESTIALASYRWRQKLSASGGNDGIFSSFRAILRIGPKNQESLANVIRAGKGVVITSSSPYRNCADVRSATHCFVDAKKLPLNREDYEYLQSCGVEIASYLYIQAYLLNGENADISAHQIKM